MSRVYLKWADIPWGPVVPSAPKLDYREACRRRYLEGVRAARVGSKVKRETERREGLASGACRWRGGVLVWRETA